MYSCINIRLGTYYCCMSSYNTDVTDFLFRINITSGFFFKGTWGKKMCFTSVMAIAEKHSSSVVGVSAVSS